jgi:hypothetical protein
MMPDVHKRPYGEPLPLSGESRAIASNFSSGLNSAIAQQSFESRLVVMLPVEPVPKIRCDCPAGESFIMGGDGKKSCLDLV